MSAGKKVLLTITSSILLVLAVQTLFPYAVNTTFAISTNCTSEEDCAKKISEASNKLSSLQSQADGVTKKITQLGTQLSVTQAEISSVQSDITDMEKQLAEINKNLADRNEKLSQKIAFRNLVIRNFSKRGVLNELELFLTSLPDKNINGFQYSTFTYMFEKNLTSEAVSLIGVINGEISNYEKDKKEAEGLKTSLEKSQKDLLALKASQQNTLGALSSEQDNLEKDLSSLTKAISALSAKQQSILAEKAGEGNGTVGDYASAEQKLPDPGFSPAFAASSYGAFTHGNGMSQYGARGRALAGQSYKDIIKFYYKAGVKTVSDFPSKIAVRGYGDMDFQKYLYGIAEMPSDWPDDALKAQAIAARTYAYKAGKPICTTESCQVFLKSKSDKPPSKWKAAVDDTKGMILDGATTAQYSSTTGGYINNVGWDTAGKWPNDAYEKKGGSPWFYKAWYTKSYSTSSDTCGRSNPWLNEKEMVDILNAWVVFEKGKSSDTDNITPLTTSCWGGDPYSMSEMASKAEEYGGKFTSVSFTKVEISSSGYTSKVIFNTNRGSTSIDGVEFKKVFNLRAPGYISIKNKLYDFVTK